MPLALHDHGHDLLDWEADKAKKAREDRHRWGPAGSRDPPFELGSNPKAAAMPPLPAGETRCTNREAASHHGHMQTTEHLIQISTIGNTSGK
jgi:hypothetical protein